MAIPIPTIDQFKDTTVMRCMRKVVDYIIEDVVPAINQSPSQDTKVSAVENSISTDSKLTTVVTNSDGSTATSVPVQLPEGGGTELNITQTPDGITINNIALQEATIAQDGLVTKEQVKAIEDNTAMGDALSKEIINGIVLDEGSISGTIKATLEQEDGTTIVSNELTLPAAYGHQILDFPNFNNSEDLATLQKGDMLIARTITRTSSVGDNTYLYGMSMTVVSEYPDLLLVGYTEVIDESQSRNYSCYAMEFTEGSSTVRMYTQRNVSEIYYDQILMPNVVFLGFVVR